VSVNVCRCVQHGVCSREVAQEWVHAKGAASAKPTKATKPKVQTSAPAAPMHSSKVTKAAAKKAARQPVKKTKRDSAFDDSESGDEKMPVSKRAKHSVPADRPAKKPATKLAHQAPSAHAKVASTEAATKLPQKPAKKLSAQRSSSSDSGSSSSGSGSSGSSEDSSSRDEKTKQAVD
jgi:hypothetical protein